jgi:hypothetical protein
MTLDDFMKEGLHRLVTQAAEQAADACDDPEMRAAIPYQFFKLECKLIGAWDNIYAAFTGKADPS